MPGMDGVEACRSIRSFSTAPILFLTAKTQLGTRPPPMQAAETTSCQSPFPSRSFS